MLLRRRRPRRGSVLVEAALVYPVVFMVILGILLLSIAVFRYQQVAHIAREASRWASVHGAKYATDPYIKAAKPSATAATAADVYTNAILPQAAGMNTSNLTYSVSWNTSNATTRTTSVNGTITTVYNTVSVTVTYRWNTGLFGTIPVSSTSTTTMCF